MKTAHYPEAKNVRLMIFDVDGILTDGRLFYTADGETIKAFHATDGLGIQLLKSTGVVLAVITARSSTPLTRRIADLGLVHAYCGVQDKTVAFADLLKKTGLSASQCGYMGDDLVDLPVMRQVAFSVTVPDAPAIVRERTHYVTARQGGNGAVREVCELIMHAQDTLAGVLQPYLY